MEILSIPTYFGREEIVKDFLIDYGIKKNYKILLDSKGNLFFTKGKSDYFPFVCAHIDSVYDEHIPLINENKRKIVKIVGKKIIGFHPDTKKRTGLAADDLAGVFICLELMDKFDNIKCGFFVEEEFGCHGSYNCDEEFFNDVGYAIQFDAPGKNWYTNKLMNKNIFNKYFNNKVKPILEKYNINNYSNDPYTDVIALNERFNICCANIASGYYNWHSDNEYVKIKDVEKAILVGENFIKKLGNKKYKFKNNGKRTNEKRRNQRL